MGGFNVVENSSGGRVEFREMLHAIVVKTDEWKITAINFSRRSQ